MRTRVVLDCDTGTDDAVAIMLAALAPSLDLLGVTTVAGNVPVEVVAENSLRVLEHIGRPDVPVFLGAARPLLRDGVADRLAGARTFEMHGTYLDLPPASGRVHELPAVEYLVSLSGAARRGGPRFTLVATAPLTNIALCVASDPAFLAGVDRIIVMGGGHAIGNVTASAEFNFWADPEAARAVVGGGGELTLVPLDATHAALVTLDDCRALRELGTPPATATAELVEQRIRAHDTAQPMPAQGSAPVHDALCVAALLDEEVLRAGRFHVDVEVDGELTIGRSVIDVHRRSGRDANATVAMDAAPERFVSVLARVFARPSEVPDST